MRRRRVRRMANGEWRIGGWRDGQADQFVQRFGGLVRRNGFGRDLLSTHNGFPQGGKVWVDITNSASRFVNTGKYRRRAWARKYGLFHSISTHFAGFTQGTGNPLVALTTSGNCQSCGRGTINSPLRINRPHAEKAHSGFTETSVITIRHSPFAIRKSHQ